MSETTWLIARETPRLRRYAMALVNDPVLADDLVQDTLERALRKRHLWRRTGSLRSWLYRMQYNIFLNQQKRGARRPREVQVDEADIGAVPSTQEQAIACGDIVAAMRRLPPEQRAAIALTAIEGLPYDEAAAVVGVPVGTLRSRLSRGRERLRELYPIDATQPQLRRVK